MMRKQWIKEWVAVGLCSFSLIAVGCGDGDGENNGTASNNNQVGQTCTGDVDCAFDQYCGVDGDSRVCKDSVCNAPAGCEGAACDVECDAGSICDGGLCRTGCRSKDDCGADDVCSEANNLCRAAGCLSDGCEQFVERCDSNMDPPLCVPSGNCENDNDCVIFASFQNTGVDYICETNSKKCIEKPPCSRENEKADLDGPGDCSAGEICEERENERNVCRQGCREDADCLGLNEFCDEEGVFNTEGRKFICLEGCDSANATESCSNIIRARGGVVPQGQEYLCENLTCIPTCGTVLSRCTAFNDENVEVSTGQICLRAPAELCSDCNICQPCTSTDQCRSSEFCDFTKGINDADAADPALGLCESLPPDCPDDGYGKNTNINDAYEITNFPFVGDGITNPMLQAPAFCNENALQGEWFQIQVQANQVITASIEYDDEALANLGLSLLTSAGTPIVSSDLPEDLDGGTEAIQYGVTAGDTFYIQVNGFVDGKQIPYNLRVNVATPPACTDDQLEENDSLGAPKVIAKDQRFDMLQVCGSDPDFYQIDAGANQIVTVKTFGKFADGNIDLRVTNPDGSVQIASSISQEDDESVFFGTQEAGTYIVEVIVADGVSNVDYELEWTEEINDCSDKYDITTGMQQANDTCGQAAVLTVTEMSPVDEKDLRLCEDTDWYEINLLPLQKVVVRTTYDRTSAGFIDLRLRGPNNCDNIVARDVPITDPMNPGNLTQELTYEATNGGKFYLVASLAQGINVKHDLKIEVVDGPKCTDDRFDMPAGSNNSIADAVTLDRSKIFLGEDNALLGLRYCDLDEDYYSLDLRTGDKVRWVVVHEATATEDLDATIFDPSGSQVSTVTGNVSNEEIEYTATADGLHTLKIFAKTPARLSYRVLTYVTPAGSMTEVGPSNPSCPDQFELNETPATATPLAGGTYSLLSCNLPAPDGADDDWFTTDVAPGDTLRVKADFINSDGNIDLFLFGEDDTSTPLVRANGFGNTEEIIYTSAIAQKMYYRVVNNTNNSSNSYSLLVERVAGGPCVDDGIAGSTGATAATVDAPGFLSQLKLCENKEDWFKMVLTEGQLAQVYVNERSIADLDLFVYSNAAGTQLIESAVTTGEGELVSFTAPDDNVGVKGPVTVWVKVEAKRNSRIDYDLITYRDLDDSGSIDPDEGIPDRECPDQFEDNDNFTNASAIGPGSYEELRFCRYGFGRGDEDFYEIFVPDGATLKVDLTFTHADGNLDLEIFRQGRTSSAIKASRSTTDNETVEDKNTTGSGISYFARVSGLGSDFFNLYDMDVNISFDTPCMEKPAALTGNNTQATAALVTPDSFEGVSLCENTEDWYAIAATNGQPIVVNVELANRLGNIDLELYDSNGTTKVAESTTTNNLESITYTATGTKTYYLRVFPRGIIRTEYDLWFSVGGNQPSAPFCADPYERNDTQLSAAPIDWNAQPGNFFGDMIACGADKDWYSVVLTNGTYKGKVFFNASTGVELDVTVLNDQGNTVPTTAQTGNDEFFSFSHVGSSKTYLVGIENTATNAVESEYGFYFKRNSTTCSDDSFEPNDSSFLPKALPDGEGTYLLATCKGAGQNDFFTFKTTKAGNIRVSIAYDTSEFDLAGSVFEPGNTSGSFVAAGQNRLVYTKNGVSAGQEFRIDLGNITPMGPKDGEGIYLLRIEEL